MIIALMELQESKAGTHQTRDLAYNKDLSDESSPRKTVFSAPERSNISNQSQLTKRQGISPQQSIRRIVLTRAGALRLERKVF